MAISGIGSTGGFDLSKNASNLASKVLKNLDTNKDGNIDRKEFVTGLTARGISAVDAGKQFDSIDTKQTGKITQADLESAIKAGPASGTPPGGKGPAGGPPPGGKAPAGGPPPGGEKTASTTTSTSTKVYDKKDSNQDGKVSASEELIYDIRNPAVSSANKTTQKLGNNLNVTA
jgi:EF hand